MSVRYLVLACAAILLSGCGDTRVDSGTPSPNAVFDRQESVEFNQITYVTAQYMLNIAEADLRPLGTATEVYSIVTDPTVFALPGIDPSEMVALRTPDGLEDPGRFIGAFMLFTRLGATQVDLKVCQYLPPPRIPPDCTQSSPSL